MRKDSKLNRFVGHFSQSAREPLGVMAHGPSPHVFGQGSENMTAACCFGNGFKHGTHLCHPGPCKPSS